MDLSVAAYVAAVVGLLLTFGSLSNYGTSELQALSLPPYLAERGYTTRIFANQVIDSVRDIRVVTASASPLLVLPPTELTPISEEVAGYFGVRELVRAGERVLGLDPPRIEIELVGNGDSVDWRTRGPHAVHGFHIATGKLPADDPAVLIRRLGAEILSYTSPFEELAYEFVQDSQIGDFERTIRIASDLIVDCEKKKPWVCTAANVAHAYVLRGLANLGAGKNLNAFSDFDSAAAIQPKNALVAVHHGDAYDHIGDAARSAELYRKAVGLDSTIGERFYALGTGLAEAGYHRLAARRFATASQLGVEKPGLQGEWGDSLFALGRYEEALERFEKANAADPKKDIYRERIEKTQKAIAEAAATAAKAPPTPPTGAATEPTRGD